MSTGAPTDRPDATLQAFLAERHTPCPRCAFDLRGLTAPRCPECGETLELALRGTSPRPLPLIATVLLSMAAGACALIVAVTLAQSAIYSLERGRLSTMLDFDDAHGGIAGLGLAILGPLLCAWLLPPTRLIDRGRSAAMAVALGSGAALLILAAVLTMAG